MSTYTMAAVEARKLAGEMVPMDASQAGEGKLAFTLRHPIGVVGAISPFNFPLNLVAHKIAPALAAGCAVVLKPASQTPLSALLLAELEEEAGLPPGWLNVLVGPAAEIGDVLVEDERVKLITFTGSGAGRLEAARARAAQARQPRARQRDAGDRRGRRRRRGRRPRSSPERVLVRRAELHLGAADLRPASDLRRLPRRASCPRVEALVVGDPADEETDVGPADRPCRRATACSRGSRRRAPAAPRSSTGGALDGELLRPTVIADAGPDAEGLAARRSSGRSARSARTTRSTRRSRSRTARATASRPASSPPR